MLKDADDTLVLVAAPVPAVGRRLMWTIVFAGGAYVVIRGTGLLAARDGTPGWLSALVILAGLTAMGTAVLFIAATTQAFFHWIGRGH